MLQIENLHQIFNEGEINEVYALRGINLQLQNEESLVLKRYAGKKKAV